MKNILDYHFPEDLKDMSEWELTLLCDDIRDFLLENVSKTGGHLASNLGVVELSVALHTVFDSPADRILWDVGHQSYVHKILTGRADEFVALRKFGGISGFPRRSESPHDVYDSGHSSDSVSIALGIAKARDIKGETFSVIDVIGDGALTGGVAYEGLNNAGASKNKLIIIVNDNQMSISRNVGGMTQHLTKLRMSPSYNSMKRALKGSLMGEKGIKSSLYRFLTKRRDNLKHSLLNGVTLFENLGFKSYGPFDGHNVVDLIDALEGAKRIDGPVVLHVVTQKGKGYRKIEENADKYHGIGPFDMNTLLPYKASNSKSWSGVFGEKLVEMADRDERIVAISAAMVDGTGLTLLKEVMPERVYDVGIAEQHAVSFAAGMALEGMRPFVCIYSTFLQRAYDEIITNVCIQNLPVVFCIDRGGNVGEDGETHNGQFDLSYLSHMPNMTVMAPSTDIELEEMLELAYHLDGPVAIRYPRGSVVEDRYDVPAPLERGCDVLSKGTDVTIIAVGKYVDNAIKAADILQKSGVSVGVVNARFVKPVDEKGLRRAAADTELVVTLEDNSVNGGFGAAVNAALLKSGKTHRIINMGWPDEFVKSGKTDMLEKVYGLDPVSVADKIKYEL